MKNLFKSIIFISLFIFLYYGFSYILLPKDNMKDFGLFKTAQYEILGEKKDSIDVVILGDSLVYSSIIPMEIYNEYGFTTFDCAEPAFILPDAYAYYKVALESQHPKVAILGGNLFFRNTRKRKSYVKLERTIKKIMPLLNYHNNWKNILFDNIGLLSIQKGYRLNKTIKPSKSKTYMEKNEKTYSLIPENLEYLEKFIELTREYNTKLIVVGFPSQNAWNYQKDKLFQDLSKKLDFEYINLNKFDLGINWKVDTKDNGEHLNFYGARKASSFLGSYLNNLGILEDHRNDKEYKLWNVAYERYLEQTQKN